MIEKNNIIDESEFSEATIEREYKSMDLNTEVKRKDSINIEFPKHFAFLKNNKNEKENEEENEEEELKLLPRSNSFNNNYTSLDYNQYNENDNDKISFSTLIYYSLPSFGKMSCLVLLNVNSTLYYESLGASLIYMSFFVILARSLEILVKPLIAHISDEINSK